ncbi:MAG: formylglycine-generating enzyme family protein [Bdellovibrionales bacterium]|nr:formylglycine-generating enzyme family protein [Bdellovibrionales bacterium]
MRTINKRFIQLFFVFTLLVIVSEPCLATTQKKITGGKFKPLLGSGKIVRVDDFYIDEAPVTNSDFQKFIEKNKEWGKGKPIRLFVDSGYLEHWSKENEVGSSNLNNSPVTNVSWFAAKKYCESLGLSLPTTEQWEYLAQFGPVGRDKNVKEIILQWYSKPTPAVLPSVKSTFKNKFGVWDVHGLIWEWTLDFNTSFVTGESRGDTALEKSMFCGSGAARAVDPGDYAAFMRFGHRSSLKGHYTGKNLGFRCAKGVKK